MSLLRVLRNLAVLVILKVGGLSLASRPAAAQSVCGGRVLIAPLTASAAASLCVAFTIDAAFRCPRRHARIRRSAAMDSAWVVAAAESHAPRGAEAQSTRPQGIEVFPYLGSATTIRISETIAS